MRVIARETYEGMQDISREKECVSDRQENGGEILDPEIRSFVSARETYEGTQDISRERKCVFTKVS